MPIGLGKPTPQKVRLNLKFDPVPENAARLADVAVQAARNVDHVDLDYSVASLDIVDGIMENLRKEGLKVEQIIETLFSFGVYVGEVLVRNAGGAWVATAGSPMESFASAPMVVHLGGEHFSNPIDKAVKRFRNGPEDSLAYFYQVTTAH